MNVPPPWAFTLHIHILKKQSCQKWSNSVISEEVELSIYAICFKGEFASFLDHVISEEDELSIHAICFKEEFAAFLNHESMHVYSKA